MSQPKKLKYASMHTTAFVPNIGQFGPTVELGGKVADMQKNGEEITFTLLDRNKKQVSVGLPSSQFQVWVYAEDNAKNSKATD